jgi:hypothetical protein
MSYKDAEARQNREAIGQFIKDRVFDENFTLDTMETLRKVIERGKNDPEDDETGAFCDWLELGNWFYEAMTGCDFDVEDFLDEVEADMQAEYAEAARDRADQMDDYYRMVGAK